MKSIEIEKINEHCYKIYHGSNRKYLGKFIMDVDGFYYYWPCEKLTGSWSSYSLRGIADKLDELNKEYEENVKEYFREHSK
jgi:hypothetical protein